MIHATTPLAFLVFAESICLLSGNIDLSVGRLTGFAAMASGVLIVTYDLPFYIIIFLPILIGLGGGIFNGILVGFGKLNPFLATLGTYMVFSGGMFMIRASSLWNLPNSYIAIGGTFWIAIPLTLFVMVILSLIVNNTCFGNHILSTGSHKRSSELLGIKTNKITFYVYAISGLLCGVAALMYTGFLGAVSPLMAREALFPALAASVIGGVSLTGGRGKFYNAIGGAILLTFIGSGIVMIGLSAYAQEVVSGLIVIAAIVGNWKREELLDRIRRTRLAKM